MATGGEKSTYLYVKDVKTITDIPRGKGSELWKAYEAGMSRAAAAAGQVTAHLWAGNTTVIDMVKPKGKIPQQYDLNLLKLSVVLGSAGMVYPVPKDPVAAGIYYRWRAYAALLTRQEQANQRIFNAVIATIAPDLLNLLEAEIEDPKEALVTGKGIEAFAAIKRFVTGGGASLRRMKMDVFRSISYKGGNVLGLFADVTKGASAVNGLGTPTGMQIILDDLNEMIDGLKHTFDCREVAVASVMKGAPKSMNDLIEILELQNRLKEKAAEAAEVKEGSDDDTTAAAARKTEEPTEKLQWITIATVMMQFVNEIGKRIKNEAKYIPEEVQCDKILTLLQTEGEYAEMIQTLESRDGDLSLRQIKLKIGVADQNKWGRSGKPKNNAKGDQNVGTVMTAGEYVKNCTHCTRGHRWSEKECFSNPKHSKYDPAYKYFCEKGCGRNRTHDTNGHKGPPRERGRGRFRKKKRVEEEAHHTADAGTPATKTNSEPTVPDRPSRIPIGWQPIYSKPEEEKSVGFVGSAKGSQRLTNIGGVRLLETAAFSAHRGYVIEATIEETPAFDDTCMHIETSDIYDVSGYDSCDDSDDNHKYAVTYDSDDSTAAEIEQFPGETDSDDNHPSSESSNPNDDVSPPATPSVTVR